MLKCNKHSQISLSVVGQAARARVCWVIATTTASMFLTR